MINKNDIEKARLFLQSSGEREIRADKTALLVVDMQRLFVDPRFKGASKYATSRTDTLARRLQKSIIPQFHKSGVRVYFVNSNFNQEADIENVEEAEKLHLIDPAWSCRKPVWKNMGNGFTDTQLHGFLAQDGIRNIFVCGVYLEWCVQSTAMGGVARKFNTSVIYDLTEGAVSVAARAKHGAPDRKTWAERLEERYKISPLSSTATLKALKA